MLFTSFIYIYNNLQKSTLESELISLQKKLTETEHKISDLQVEKERRAQTESRLSELSQLLSEAGVLQQFLEKEILAREHEVLYNISVEAR